jgi:hypothetical protein
MCHSRPIGRRRLPQQGWTWPAERRRLVPSNQFWQGTSRCPTETSMAAAERKDSPVLPGRVPALTTMAALVLGNVLIVHQMTTPDADPPSVGLRQSRSKYAGRSLSASAKCSRAPEYLSRLASKNSSRSKHSRRHAEKGVAAQPIRLSEVLQATPSRPVPRPDRPRLGRQPRPPRPRNRQRNRHRLEGVPAMRTRETPAAAPRTRRPEAVRRWQRRRRRRRFRYRRSWRYGWWRRQYR